jgi:hypothetical protein
MSGKRAKKIRKYALKLMEMHPTIYKDRMRTYPVKNVQMIIQGRLITIPIAPKQFFSGFRLAKKHAKLGLQLEQM